jgi:hypothetical protein
LFGLIVGSMLILASFAGYAVHLYQWQQENNVLTHSPARARIVSAAPKQAGGNRVTDARLDYVRQAAAGAVKCKNAQIRFRGWSGDFDVGKAVDVYPQGINCHGPIYAPDIGNPRTTLLVSLIAFSIGTALFTASYRAFRRRREAQARDIPPDRRHDAFNGMMSNQTQSRTSTPRLTRGVFIWVPDNLGATGTIGFPPN